MARFSLAVLVAILLNLIGASPSPSQKGFQSINCGGGILMDPETGIQWDEDPFINESNELRYGIASKVFENITTATTAVTTLRYFPRESTNRKFCYTLRASRGNTYLVRASFLYGNYDKLNQPPSFFLIINYSKWTSVTTSLSTSPIIKELIFISNDPDLNICLAPNTSTNHTPFISALELRPLDNTMYIQSTFISTLFPSGLSKGYGLMLWQRINYGAKTVAITRFPNDTYDRIWEANTTGPAVSINASQVGTFYDQDLSQPPAEVMATAITTKDPQANLSFMYQGLGSVAGVRVEMHFEEVDGNAQTTRQFGIAFPSSNFTVVEKDVPIVPATAGPISVVVDQPVQLPVPFQITLFPLAPSPFGPLLNAIEIFQWTPQPLSPTGTFPGDVNAIILIQTHFKLIGYGQGDPCMPNGYEWPWIVCSDDSQRRITDINLASLNLTGDIPPSINDLSSLQTIDFSHNMLSGSIPAINNLYNLKKLDVSYNNLCGSSPSFQTQTTVDYKDIGNNLCDGSKCDCKSSMSSISSSVINISSKKNNTKKYIIAICFMGALYIVTLMILLIFCKVRNIRRREGKATSNMRQDRKGVGDLKGLPYVIKMFTYNEISNATLNFTTILGEGGFGKVYHGILPTGAPIAVKLLADASKQGLKEFYNEVAILSRVRHKNLVCLLGCCVENTHMLIYEYIEKGNLKDLLYGDMESSDKPLGWATRLQIALDASQGLEYLHTGCDPPIIHRDVKSSNILLSDKTQGKLADFGLSRLKEGETNISHISTVNVVGTPGYLDPAYNATNQLTDKSDVYSFGIVLLELVCGRAPIDMFTIPPYIVDWVKSSIMQGKVGDVVDPMLGNGYKVESLLKVVDVAIGCVENDREKRPKMSQVSQVLQVALEIETNESLSPSSNDTSGSSSTSIGKIPTLQYIKNIEVMLQPR